MVWIRTILKNSSRYDAFGKITRFHYLHLRVNLGVYRGDLRCPSSGGNVRTRWLPTPTGSTRTRSSCSRSFRRYDCEDFGRFVVFKSRIDRYPVGCDARIILYGAVQRDCGTRQLRIQRLQGFSDAETTWRHDTRVIRVGGKKSLPTNHTILPETFKTSISTTEKSQNNKTLSIFSVLINSSISMLFESLKTSIISCPFLNFHSNLCLFKTIAFTSTISRRTKNLKLPIC